MQGLARALDVEETRVESAEPFHVPMLGANDHASKPAELQHVPRILTGATSSLRMPASRRLTSYCCAAGVSTLNIAPCGSIRTADRPTVGMSNGSTAICPPPALACAA